MFEFLIDVLEIQFHFGNDKIFWTGIKTTFYYWISQFEPCPFMYKEKCKNNKGSSPKKMSQMLQMFSWLNEQLKILHSYHKSKKIWQETLKLELFV